MIEDDDLNERLRGLFKKAARRYLPTQPGWKSLMDKLGPQEDASHPGAGGQGDDEGLSPTFAFSQECITAGEEPSSGALQTSPSQDLTFDDELFTGSVVRDKEGRRRLTLNHSALPPATLLEVELCGSGAGGAPARRRYLAFLRRRSGGKCTATLLVTDDVPRNSVVLVRPVEISELLDEDAARLRAALEAADGDDPESRVAWRSRAGDALSSPAVQPRIRALLEGALKGKAPGTGASDPRGRNGTRLGRRRGRADSGQSAVEARGSQDS